MLPGVFLRFEVRCTRMDVSRSTCQCHCVNNIGIYLKIVTYILFKPKSNIVIDDDSATFSFMICFHLSGIRNKINFNLLKNVAKMQSVI